ncbi:MAG: PIG-L deacetylase family protein [Chloroflexota bacterium]
MTTHTYIPERALVIVAHCDDIEFGISGTVAKWTHGGTKVTYCIVTDSGSGDNTPGADLAALRATRIEEQNASAKIVGVEDVRYLNYPDGTLEPTMELRRQLTRLIRELKPNVVATFDPETILPHGRAYINHPDHRAVGIAATYAVFPSAGARPIFLELLEEGLEPHNVDRIYYTLSNHENHFSDISEYIEQKADALRCHTSQLDEKVVQMVMQWNRENGKRLGTGYAEGFRVLIFKDEDAKEAEETATTEVEGATEA